MDLQSPEVSISVDDYDRYLEMLMDDFCQPLYKQFTCQVNSLQKLCADRLWVMASNSVKDPIRIIEKFNKVVYNCSHVKRLSHEILGWPRQYLLENQKKINELIMTDYMCLIKHCGVENDPQLQTGLYRNFKKRLIVSTVVLSLFFSFKKNACLNEIKFNV